jgi:hypothetical protein
MDGVRVTRRDCWLCCGGAEHDTQQNAGSDGPLSAIKREFGQLLWVRRLHRVSSRVPFHCSQSTNSVGFSVMSFGVLCRVGNCLVVWPWQAAASILPKGRYWAAS